MNKNSSAARNEDFAGGSSMSLFDRAFLLVAAMIAMAPTIARLS